MKGDKHILKGLFPFPSFSPSSPCYEAGYKGTQVGVKTASKGLAECFGLSVG